MDGENADQSIFQDYYTSPSGGWSVWTASKKTNRERININSNSTRSIISRSHRGRSGSLTNKQVDRVINATLNVLLKQLGNPGVYNHIALHSQSVLKPFIKKEVCVVFSADALRSLPVNHEMNRL